MKAGLTYTSSYWNALKGEILYQNKVIINCRSEKSIHPELLKSLLVQTAQMDTLIYESDKHPTRLQHIQNQDALYFFF